MIRRALRKLSWPYLFAFVVVMFSVGAIPVFGAFFATNGVRAATVTYVILTALIMIAIAGAIVAAAERLKRRLIGEDDDTAQAG